MANNELAEQQQKAMAEGSGGTQTSQGGTGEEPISLQAVESTLDGLATANTRLAEGVANLMAQVSLVSERGNARFERLET